MKKMFAGLSHNNKVLLANKFFDLCIVIVGVTIAFQLNNLKQNADQRSLEKFYNENLLIELDKDINRMNEIVVSLRADKRWTDKCLDTQKGLTADTLQSTVLEILSFETFNDRNDNTYRALVSNGSSTIRNRVTRSLIQDYYKCYTNIDRFESVYTEFILNHFNVYFSPYYDYASKKLLDASIVKNAQTKNHLLIAASQLNDGIESYEDALSKAATLKNALLKTN